MPMLALALVLLVPAGVIGASMEWCDEDCSGDGSGRELRARVVLLVLRPLAHRPAGIGERRARPAAARIAAGALRDRPVVA